MKMFINVIKRIHYKFHIHTNHCPNDVKFCNFPISIVIIIQWQSCRFTCCTFSFRVRYWRMFFLKFRKILPSIIDSSRSFGWATFIKLKAFKSKVFLLTSAENLWSGREADDKTITSRYYGTTNFILLGWATYCYWN